MSSPTTPDWVRSLYRYQQDSKIITPELTESFLKVLQQRLPQSSAQHAAQGAAATSTSAKLIVGSNSSKVYNGPAASSTSVQPESGSNSSSTSIDIAPFVRVAHDVLSYLRFCRSEVLLQLLREFSSTGDLSLEATDPDILQREVLQLLNHTSLNRWYQYTTSKDGLGHHAPSAPADDSQAAGGRRLLSTATATLHHSRPGRKTLQHTPRRALLSQDALIDAQLTSSDKEPSGSATAGSVTSSTQLSNTESGSTLSGTTAGSTAPLGSTLSGSTAPLGSTLSGSTAPLGSTLSSRTTGATSFAVQPATTTAAVEQTLEDMLCSVKQYSPTGLTGVVPGVQDCSTADTLAVSPPRTQFAPVEIPVAFHLLRFSQNGTLLPPDWDAEQAAKNLVDVASRLYFGTGISFKLAEVRTNPEQYPYLQLPTLEGWQACTHNGVDASGGIACLRRLAQDPSVVALVNKQIINVFVSGSVDQAAYCDKPQTPAPGCTTVSLGYCEARGPWFSVTAGRSSTWTEDSPSDNWVFISHDMFNPNTRNSVRFWNGGGATLAHEIGHYLGLMHTHEGAQPCDQNPTRTDAVLDTPPNQAIDSYAASTNSLSRLAGWCSDFRLGRQPPAAELEQFKSCKDSGYIDNVFNLQSYVPDPCMMAFTPRQVERLQWAITSFRPKLAAAYSA